MSSYQNQIKDLSPILWYRFDEIGEPTNYGSSSVTLTTTGTPTYSHGGIAINSYYFNAGAGYETTSNLGTDVLNNKIFSIETWFKIASGDVAATGAGYHTFFSATNGTQEIGFRMKGGSETSGERGKIQAYIVGGSGNSTPIVTSPLTYHDDKWHHAVYTCDNTTLRLYVDGREVATAAIGTMPTSLGIDASGTNNKKYIAGKTGEYTKGYLDEFALYTGALTAQQVIDNYEKGIKRNGYQKQIDGLSPLVYYRFDDVAGLPVNYGSHALTLTTNGTPTPNQSGGISNTSYYFGGGAGFASTTSMPTNTFNDKVFTVETWFKLAAADTAASNYHTLYVGVGSSGQVLYFRIVGGSGTDNGKIQMVWLASGYSNKTILSSGTFDDGNWHHAVLVCDGTNAKIYVDNTEVGSTAINTSWPTTMSMDGTTNKVIAWADTNEGIKGNLDEFAIYNSALTTTNIADNYNAKNWANHDADPGVSLTSSFPMPVFSNSTNKTVNADPATASADAVNPAVAIGVDLNAFGVATSTVDIVHPTIYVEKQLNYSADPATASATSPNAVAAATKTVNYSASASTASALLSSNVFAGKTEQDTSYNLIMRSIRTTGTTRNVDAANGFSIGTQSSNYGNTIESKWALIVKPDSGFPTYNKIIKAKVDGTHVTTSGGDYSPQNTFNIYVLTGNPTSGTFTTGEFDDFTTNREYLYTTRIGDDNTSNYLFDLTSAFADSRSATYGIMIEHVFTAPNSASSVWDRTEFYGSGLDNGKFLYVLSSDLVNKTVNADVATASALNTDVTISTEKYVNYSHTVATASADIVHPAVGLSIGYDSSPATASAEAVQPAFSRTVEYPHTHAEAFGDIPNPTWFAAGTINLTADAMTASALIEMAGISIGDGHIAVHFSANAEMVEPTLIIPRLVDAMVTTASVEMPTPSVNTQLLGVFLATPMTATALAPNPPAYLNLFADPWYSTLYAQHSVRHGLPTGYGGAFLKIFEDQNTDITQSTPNTAQSQNTFNGIPTLRDLRNNVTYGISVNSGPENDNRYVAAPAITDYSTAANESRMSVGYFDNWNRKAIRLQNIAFQAKSGLTYSKSDFSMEFSIKTTKANQIISYGDWLSPTSSNRVKTTFNLVDGKLNYMTYAAFEVLHPNSTKPYSETQWAQRLRGQLTGNTRIDDGQWHHVIIQFVEGPEGDDGIVGRVQFWIDGNLDIQRFNQSVYDPDFMGANIEDATFAPDFYTSAWSIDAPATVVERDIDLHYYDFIKYEPILAAPMTASLTMTSGNIGKGNRQRALMLYWWPTTSGQNQNLITRTFDSAYQTTGYNEFDINMFDNDLETIDYINQPPQQYYGWDVFPVDINGYFVSDLVKEEAYGGASNITERTLGGAILTTGDLSAPKFKVNRRGYFRSALDDTRRYIDLVNDIDLSQFDAIFFKNYPDQSNEIDAFARNEIVDPYFNIRETKIYQDFINSLRNAVDTGISLMVNNPQLALDLKIIDRIEVVPDLQDTRGYQSDPYTPSIVPSQAQSLPVGNGTTVNVWDDTFKNNRLRVLNTFEDITNWRSVIFTKAAYWENDDTLNYGGADRPFKGFEYKPNGLAVGDEFFISTFQLGDNRLGKTPRNYLAVPIQNIKAGTPITAFANQYRQGLNLVDNPYKNHVTSIAVKPGDVLDGRQVNGKIFVNFTEAINQEDEFVSIDGIHTQWINLAYNDGTITLAERDALLASTSLLENRLASGNITQAEYNILSSWQSNGMYILTQAEQLETGDGKSDFTGDQTRKATVRKTSRAGITSSASVSFGGQFFAFKYARQYQQLVFEAISMNTRGFRWLSDRVASIEQSQAHTAMSATGIMVQPIIVAEKEVSINAQAMLANATKIPAVGYAGNDVQIISLPLQATALMTSHVKLVSAEPMTATAAFREQIVTRTTATDQVIVYVLHEDPILYLREDIIK